MKKILAALAATLTMSLATGVAAMTASISEVPNNSVANEALGRAASRLSCDDPFVAQVCARANLFAIETFSSSQALMGFTQAVARSEVGYDSSVGAVIDRGDLYVFENRAAQLRTAFPQNNTNFIAPPEFEGEEVLEQPLPAAAPILLAGLAALGLFSRRRRNA